MTKLPNPMIIQKDSSPYLYLTDFSGIYLNNYDTENVVRGIELPINGSEATDYNLLSLQLWIRYPENLFYSTLPVVEIVGEDFNITVTARALDNGSRAMIESNSSILFYQNGVKVINPVITAKDWNSIYLVFPNPLSFSNFAGKIVLKPRFVFNNVSEFIYENEISEDIRQDFLAWLEVWKNLSTNAARDWLNISNYNWGAIQ